MLAQRVFLEEINVEVMNKSDQGENHRHNDRRNTPTPMLSRYTFFGGRRTGERRTTAPVEGMYIDQYSPKVLLFVLSLYALNVLDAILTLCQIEKGAVEVNPVARVLLDLGPIAFVLTKCLGVGLILCFLCLHTNFKRSRLVLISGVTLYFAVASYHVVTYWFL
ncbi:MAG: DUF5658 family protein [Planctomycetota bacterium]